MDHATTTTLGTNEDIPCPPAEIDGGLNRSTHHPGLKRRAGVNSDVLKCAVVAPKTDISGAGMPGRVIALIQS